jgi:hypothetical protein
MKGSIATKLLRMAAAAAARPQDVPRYIAHLRTPPIVSGLPWFTSGAIDFLDAWIKPQHHVFEYGCGGSTLFFAARAGNVDSVEHNARWQLRVRAALIERSHSNIRIHLHAAGREPPLADSEYCRALDRPFDVIAIDGWAMGKCSAGDRRAVQSRAACFARAESFAQPGSIIVLDDSWFLPDLSHRARERRSFIGLGPWRIGASATDVFFY